MQRPTDYAQHLRTRIETLEDEQSRLLAAQLRREATWEAMRELERLVRRHAVTSRRLERVEAWLSVPMSGGDATRRVLLVEDAPESQRLMAHHLRASGHRVVVAGHGGEALALMDGEADEPLFDLVLMDMRMPRVDGYRATRALRERGHEVPVLALTAEVGEGARERCLAAGCDDYLAKPVSGARLAAACSAWLARSAAHTAA